MYVTGGKCSVARGRKEQADNSLEGFTSTFKALQTMVSNLEKTEAEKQATIAELEDYMKNHIGDTIEIKAKITATRKIADIYPRMTSTHDSSLFDDSFAMDFINHGDKIIYCAMYLYIGYIN